MKFVESIDVWRCRCNLVKKKIPITLKKLWFSSLSTTLTSNGRRKIREAYKKNSHRRSKKGKTGEGILWWLLSIQRLWLKKWKGKQGEREFQLINPPEDNSKWFRHANDTSKDSFVHLDKDNSEILKSQKSSKNHGENQWSLKANLLCFFF